MEIQERIDEDFKRAMKSRAEREVKTLKIIRSELRNAEIKAGEKLDEDAVKTVLARQAKQRRESIDQ